MSIILCDILMYHMCKKFIYRAVLPNILKIVGYQILLRIMLPLLQKCCLRSTPVLLYGRVIRRDEDNVGRNVLEMQLSGERKRERPKRRSCDQGVTERYGECAVATPDGKVERRIFLNVTNSYTPSPSVSII